jgi:hypothetical protein|tara:strand:+ start:10 stop:195 length:186 start_codon:yes stop_codon:yes gene_type:complete
MRQQQPCGEQIRRGNALLIQIVALQLAEQVLADKDALPSYACVALEIVRRQHQWHRFEVVI